MALALFDLDNTLLRGDSDDSWAKYLASTGKLDWEEYSEIATALLKKGDDIGYLNYCLSTVLLIDKDDLELALEEFVSTYIEPLVSEKTINLINEHRDKKNTLIIVTATNEIITRPIATLLNIDNLIATEAEKVKGRITGKVCGLPSFAKGKVSRVVEWLSQHNHLSLEGSYFYSDSDSDIPLLEAVDYPYAVNPNENLTKYATDKNWPIISLK